MDENNIHHSHQESEDQPRDKFFKIRNTLNTIFIVGAIVGVAVYFLSNRTTGIYIILAAMVFKMAECSFRIINRK